MKIEDRLSDALRDYADRIEPEPGSWARIASRFDDEPARPPKRPARGPLVLAGVALALVVVLIAVLVVRNGDGTTRVVTKPSDAPTEPAAEPTPAPVGVLIVRRGGEMVVVGTQDGQQHSSLGTYPDASSLSTTADGRQVFFAERGESGACGKPRPYQDVTRLVPATGEQARVVGGALSPTVGPDGKLIAYGISCEGPGLGFTNLVTGENSRSDALGSKAHETDDRIETVEPLGWSPDSTELLYRLGLQGDASPHFYVGRLWPAVPQSQTKVTELPGRSDVTAAAFIDNDTVALAGPTGATTEVRRWTVSTGSKVPSPVLFEVPGRVTSLVADRSGQHFLALTDAGDLYRWSPGEDQPTKIAGDVEAATWLPWS